MIFGGGNATDPGPISAFSSPIIGAQSLAQANCRPVTLTRTLSYSYDRLHRLTAASYPAAGLGQPAQSYAYAYDAAGNRTSQTINGVVTTYQYDAANRLTQSAVSGQPSAVNYTWDDNGNLLSDGARTYNDDSANRLTSVLDNGVITQYAYTGDGDRVSQTVGGVATSYVFDPVGLTQVLAETTNGVSTFYVPGLAQYNVGGWQYFGQNRLGSVRTLINPTGELLLARNYDPFGNVLAQGGVGSSGFGYTGEQTDSTGLVYLRARYYQPAVGRFLTPDSTVSNPFGSQDWNRYDYVGNNPVVYVDPSGRCRGLSGAAFDACAAVVMTTAAGVHQANEYREDIFFPDADTTFADRLEASIVVGGGSVLFAAGTVEAGGAIFGGGPLTTAIGSGNIIGGGSGIAAVCANGKCESTAKLGLNSFSRAAEFGINAYNQLRPYTQGTGLQRHHLVEQRFARVLGGNPCNWPSIALTPQEHQAFTNAWRNFIVPK